MIGVRRDPRFLAGTTACLTLMTACSANGPGNWDDAVDHVGESTTICGPVMGVRTSGDDTFVNVGRDYPDDDRFSIVVWDAGETDLQDHEGDDVCVTGAISEYQGVAQIQVRDPEVLRFGPPGTADERLDAAASSGDAAEAEPAEEPSAEEPAIGRADDLVMGDMRVHVRAWNDLLSPVVAGYLDPNVDRPEWVKQSGPVFGLLEPKVRAMADLAAQLSNPDLRGVALDVVANYRDKLQALALLVNAVAKGNGSAERSAALQIRKASDAGNRLAERMMELLPATGCAPDGCSSID